MTFDPGATRATRRKSSAAPAWSPAVRLALALLVDRGGQALGDVGALRIIGGSHAQRMREGVLGVRRSRPG